MTSSAYLFVNFEKNKTFSYITQVDSVCVCVCVCVCVHFVLYLFPCRGDKVHTLKSACKTDQADFMA